MKNCRYNHMLSFPFISLPFDLYVFLGSVGNFFFFYPFQKYVKGNDFVEYTFVFCFCFAIADCFLLVFAQLYFLFFLIRKPPFIGKRTTI